jgi:hypothetical protein
MKHPRPIACEHIRVLRTLTVAGAIFAVVLAPGARASTAEMRDSYLVYRADAGEVNVVSIVHSSDGLITVTDTGAVIQATNGCVSKDVHVAECGHPSLPEGSDLHWHDIELGDGDDSFEVFGLEQGVLTDYDVSAGDGDDVLSGGNENDHLGGGPGSDRLDGGGGDDTLDGGTAADVMRGGFGTDSATYFDREVGIRVEIGDDAQDGEPGEGDDVQTDNVIGGTGDDVLIGNVLANRLEGGPGQDVLSGRGGDDELVGTDARVSADPTAPDQIRCGGGLDTAHLSGPDTARDSCEQLAHDTPLRIGVTAPRRPGPRRVQVTAKRLDADHRGAIAEALLSVPCGPARDDGTRCWTRVGRSRDSVTIAGGGAGVVAVVLSRRGRRWLRRHPRRRPQLSMLAYIEESPGNPVQLRLRVRVPRP